MDFEIPWRRIATGAGVVVLHIIAIYLLALAMHVPLFATHEARETILTLMQPNGSRTIQQNLHIPTPKMITPEYEPNAITLPKPMSEKDLEEPNLPANLGGVGSYLYNCSGMYYEQLNAHERAGCLLNKWDVVPSNSPLLGVARQSPYDAVIAKRQAPDAAGSQHLCDQTAINSNLGLPCYNFAGH